MSKCTTSGMNVQLLGFSLKATKCETDAEMYMFACLEED